MPPILFDTNILVYAHDRSDRDKQERAIAALDHFHVAGQGRLSTQTLAEFFVIATNSTRRLLKVTDAAKQVERLLRAWPVLDVTPLVILEAVRGVRDHQMSYWDSQLWATARLNQVPLIFSCRVLGGAGLFERPRGSESRFGRRGGAACGSLSEDFNAGAVLDGVRFVNPLLDHFDLTAWG